MTQDQLFAAIEYLRSERDRIDHVIRMIESLGKGRTRRGRPPKFITEAKKQRRSKRPKKRDSSQDAPQD